MGHLHFWIVLPQHHLMLLTLSRLSSLLAFLLNLIWCVGTLLLLSLFSGKILALFLCSILLHILKLLMKSFMRLSCLPMNFTPGLAISGNASQERTTSVFSVSCKVPKGVHRQVFSLSRNILYPEVLPRAYDYYFFCFLQSPQGRTTTTFFCFLQFFCILQCPQ